MTYTGQVVVGGRGDVRRLDEVEVRKLAVGPLANDVYLLTCRRTGAQVLIDAADAPDDVLALVREGSSAARLDVVVTTHRHLDHLRALASIVAVTGAATAVGAPDADAVAAAADVHEPEAVAGRVHLFTGDSLFPGGVGSAQHDPDRFDQLLTDVTERVFDRFDDETWVYPGHGADTTIGAERPHLDEWRERGW